MENSRMKVMKNGQRGSAETHLLKLGRAATCVAFVVGLSGCSNDPNPSLPDGRVHPDASDVADAHATAIDAHATAIDAHATAIDAHATAIDAPPAAIDARSIDATPIASIDASVADAALPSVDAAPPAPPALNFIAGWLGGSGRQDGIGTFAQFNAPIGGTYDDNGHFFVADSNNNTIRQIDLATGAVTTFAGTAGSAGNVDDTGLNAKFNGPQDVTFDGNGNLFVIDGSDCVVRQIVISTAAVTTIAGMSGQCSNANGVGAMARFQYPYGIVADHNGSLFIADYSNNAVRQIDIATATVSTLASGLAGPFGVTSDLAGDIFVADFNDHTIKEINVATKAVTLIAGTAGQSGTMNGIGAAALFHGPQGITFDGNGHLFVSEAFNHTIREIDLSNNNVTTLAGVFGVNGYQDGAGATALFNQPQGVRSDGNGNLLVMDTNNQCVREIDVATATVSTLAGAPNLSGNTDGFGLEARFSSANAIVYVPGSGESDAGSLFIADSGNSLIRKVDIATGEVTTFAGDPTQRGSNDGAGEVAQFNNPSGITHAAGGLGSPGTLFVADSGNHTIRQIDIATAMVTTLVGDAGTPGSTDAMGSDALFNNPNGIVFDGAGNLFVTDTGNSTIRQIDVQTTMVSTLAGQAGSTGSTNNATGTSARFNNPNGIAYGDVGQLFVVDSNNNLIRQIDISTSAVSTLAGIAQQYGHTDGLGSQAEFIQPHSVVFYGVGDGLGRLFVSDQGNREIREIDIATTMVSTLVSQSAITSVHLGPLATATLSSPAGIEIVPALLGTDLPTLYITDSNESALLSVSNVP